MASITEQKILSTLPWKKPIPEYSYAGVATFSEKDNFIIVPLQKTDDYMEYAKIRAEKIGSNMLEKKKWSKFNFIVRKKKWPHLILKGK